MEAVRQMPKGKKILLVEDDDLFRETVQKSLIKKGFEVIEVPNGKKARECLLLHKVDLIISDIQMPHFTGIDLLEWVKSNCPTPLILMTGFSQALETKKAHELGAADFLAKPFRDADLNEVLLRHFGESKTPEPAVVEDLDKQFCKIAIEDFISEKENETTIYLRVSSTKYIKIAHPGGKIPADRIRSYQEKGMEYVYVKKEDFAKVVKFNLAVAKVVTQSQVSTEKKVNFLRNTGELVLEKAFVSGVDEENFMEAKDFVGYSMEALATDDEIFTLLNVLSDHNDFIYAHSLGVSTFAVMIAKELGWTSTQTLFKLAMGGLFHDIGKKEIDKAILEKPRALLSQAERNLIETHTTRGKEILESLPKIPSEVIEIAYAHHEDLLGHGFPRQISKHQIHPLVKVVNVANIFCEYAVKHHPATQPMSAKDAVKRMENMKAETMDPEIFLALKRLIK